MIVLKASDFKVGDKIVCVDAGGHTNLSVGGTYTVGAINGDYLKLVEVFGDKFPNRFRMLSPVLTGASTGMILSEDATERKNTPICTGVVDYFPRALAAVAACSKAGNDQHNPGQPLHWAKEKSTDHADCIMRHLIDRNVKDTDGHYHAAKLAWRALANLEIFLENLEKEKK